MLKIVPYDTANYKTIGDWYAANSSVTKDYEFVIGGILVNQVELYSLVRKKATGEYFILATYILKGGPAGWVYIYETNELENPNMRQCPKCILEIAGTPTNENAIKWREACWHAVRAHELPTGTVIRFKEPIEFQDGRIADTFMIQSCGVFYYFYAIELDKHGIPSYHGKYVVCRWETREFEVLDFSEVTNGYVEPKRLPVFSFETDDFFKALKNNSTLRFKYKKPRSENFRRKSDNSFLSRTVKDRLKKFDGKNLNQNFEKKD